VKLIVNKVVESYLKEIVLRDRDLRRKNQADLEESYKRQKERALQGVGRP